MTKKFIPINNWIKDNLWNLLATAVLIIVTWTTFNARLNAVEARVAQYPSQDWFDLKFTNIDDKFNILGNDLQEVKDALKEHVNK